MKPLTAKQLKFCLLIVEGETQSKAYKLAGYKTQGEITTAANASRLANSEKVAAKITELQSKAAKKTGITVENLTEELMIHNAMAKQLGQIAAATGALALAARLAGLLVDHKTVDITHHKPARTQGLKDIDLSEDEWLRLYKPSE
jgi:phage terminase small subunit